MKDFLITIFICVAVILVVIPLLTFIFGTLSPMASFIIGFVVGVIVNVLYYGRKGDKA